LSGQVNAVPDNEPYPLLEKEDREKECERDQRKDDETKNSVSLHGFSAPSLKLYNDRRFRYIEQPGLHVSRSLQSLSLSWAKITRSGHHSLIHALVNSGMVNTSQTLEARAPISIDFSMKSFGTDFLRWFG